TLSGNHDNQFAELDGHNYLAGTIQISTSIRPRRRRKPLILQAKGIRGAKTCPDTRPSLKNPFPPALDL
ncbi:MAG TPA: hypothetical protein PLL56_03605, partial [Verrucomicrobiota bacterium]|nr:hypothetical protein [Verrucomicrobiota bacterium]HOX61942.1 hypothetical protein [Verrucomicrobiota bacterium]